MLDQTRIELKSAIQEANQKLARKLTVSFDNIDLRIDNEMYGYDFVRFIIDELLIDSAVYNRESSSLETVRNGDNERGVTVTVGNKVNKEHFYSLFNILGFISKTKTSDVNPLEKIYFQIRYFPDFQGSEYAIVIEPEYVFPRSIDSKVSDPISFFRIGFGETISLFELKRNDYVYMFPYPGHKRYDALEEEQEREWQKSRKARTTIYDKAASHDYNYLEHEKQGWNPFVEDALDGEGSASWNLD